MKRSVVIWAILALMFSAVSAFGGVRDFGRFTLYVPGDWTATQQGDTTILMKDDNTASMSITITEAEGSARYMAESLASEFEETFESVSTPERDSDGDYSWEMVNSYGVTTYAMLRVYDGEVMLITMTGVESAGEDIAAILGSVKDK